ncbi:hypothetical protein BSR29_05365 [Boudabousia liubingyangii]|uniref:Uncharacterized protein n=1 Tax=Boudabousia liubingyangii TaxID=1921764 RepID=A0A1Q5PLH7_9ACTO|nr:hypothetical protein [Boudabousia liubingyangii]OKL47914.1 hypothetical protein BSR29_05365 [Boudabousia liubingyangii]
MQRVDFTQMKIVLCKQSNIDRILDGVDGRVLTGDELINAALEDYLAFLKRERPNRVENVLDLIKIGEEDSVVYNEMDIYHPHGFRLRPHVAAALLAAELEEVNGDISLIDPDFRALLEDSISGK